jgi:hypothetical protein
VYSMLVCLGLMFVCFTHFSAACKAYGNVEAAPALNHHPCSSFPLFSFSRCLLVLSLCLTTYACLITGFCYPIPSGGTDPDSLFPLFLSALLMQPAAAAALSLRIFS